MQSALGRANIFIECHLVKPVTCRIFLLLKAMLMCLHLKINRHSWIKKVYIHICLFKLFKHRKAKFSKFCLLIIILNKG